MDVVDESGERRNEPPRDQDASDPDTRTNPVQKQVAGNFKQEIADEKDPNHEPVLLSANSQIPVHGQRGKTYVNTVDVGDHIKQKDEWENPPLQLANRSGFQAGCFGRYFVGHDSPRLTAAAICPT